MLGLLKNKWNCEICLVEDIILIERLTNAYDFTVIDIKDDIEAELTDIIENLKTTNQLN
jgi:hypothetical protein